MSAPLTARYEAIVRLMHAAGSATLADVLTAYRAQALTAKQAHRILEQLTDYGWLVRVRSAGARRSSAPAWAVSEPAMPHLLHCAALPRRPQPLLSKAAAVAPAPRRVPQRPAAVGPATPPPYRGDWRGHQCPPYVPPRAVPARAGALDFLRCPSHGACR